jgi:hypothetical protein
MMAAASPSSDRLAAPLLRLAERVLAQLPRDDAAPARAALRAFTTAPSPAGFLAAARLLRTSERRHKLALLGRAQGARRTENGLEALARAGLAPELLDALRTIPSDARNGRRFEVIADLLAAYRLVEARATEAHRELQQGLGPVPIRRGATERRRRLR